MEELLKEVGRLVNEELINANENNQEKFNSMHEGYAVILEEIQEAEEELDRVKRKMNTVWGAIRRDEYPKDSIDMVRYCAKLVACEAIQVAAMSQKFINSFKSEV